MRIYVPYTAGGLHPAVVEALCQHYPTPRFLKIDPGDVYAYARLVIDLWERGETFAIVEHDTVPPPGALTTMEFCPAPWCTVPHSVGGAPSLSLFGCVKLSGVLTGARRTLAADTLAGPVEGRPATHWRHVALRMTSAMHQAGYEPCAHGTQTVHHNPAYERSTT